jgi:hypothetical protein
MTAATPAERSRAYRDRVRGRPVALAPCGTRSAATRHRRNGEPLCLPCIKAERAYMNGRNRTPTESETT